MTQGRENWRNFPGRELRRGLLRVGNQAKLLSASPGLLVRTRISNPSDCRDARSLLNLYIYDLICE